ncbi:MAG TPA: FtsX-like permease family protein [Chloroflexia bacterium]|nr:FtsX-like permease family protein [Chloroflexia bacterium]
MFGLLFLSSKSLVSNAGRWLFTGVAIALGVGGIVATLTIDNALIESLNGTARQLLGRADAEVLAMDESGLSPAAVARLAAVPQVAAAVPRLTKLTYFQGGGTRGFLSLTGIDPQQDPALHPMSVVSGQALGAGADAGVLLPQGWAAQVGLRVGDPLQLITAAGLEPFTIRGLVGGADGLITGSYPAAFVNLETMRRSFALGARVSEVGVQYVPGTTGAAAAIAAAVQEPYLLRDLAGTQAALAGGQRDFRWLLGLFGVLALVAGGVQILNTLAIVAQGRSREMVLLRAAGATRSQILGILLWEAGIVGALGSLGGMVVGWLLAGTLSALVQAGRGLAIAVGLDLPAAGVGLLAGIGLSLLAALIPAGLTAGREPLAVLRPAPPARAARRSLGLLAVSTAVLLGLFGVVVAALLGQRSAPAGGWLIGGFAAALFLGLLLLLLVGLPLLSRLVEPLLRGSGAGLAILAQQSLRWRRANTAVTASALTIAVALLATLLVLSVSAESAGRNATHALFAAPYVLVAPGAQPAAIIADVVAASGATSASPLRRVTLSWDGHPVDAVALDPQFYAEAPDALPLVAGDRPAALAALGAGDALLVPADFARRYGLPLGGTMQIWTPGAGPRPFQIAGLLRRSFPAADSAGALVLANSTLKARFGIDSFTQLLVRGAGPGFGAQLTTAAESYGLQAQSADELADNIGRTIAQTLLLFGALTAAAGVVGALSIVNAMSLNVLERTRVIGLLRAAGMTAGQVALMIMLEAALVGLLAGVLGVALGTGLGWLLFGSGQISQDATFLASPWLLLLVPAPMLLAALASLRAAQRAAATAALTAVRHP